MRLLRLPTLAALAMLVIATPAFALHEMVILANESTDVFTLSLDGAPPCTASPGSGCIRSARPGRIQLEACSAKQCLKVEIALAEGEVLQFTVEERRETYTHTQEKRIARFY
jgi:hypothetical protein